MVINSSAHFNMTSARIVEFDVTNRTKFENAQLIIMKNAAELASGMHSSRIFLVGDKSDTEKRWISYEEASEFA